MSPYPQSRLTPAPLLEDEIRVWIVSLALEPEPAERLSRLLSDEEQERAARFRLRRDAIRFRVSRAALRTILGACLGVEPQVLDFRYGPRGKPELAPRFGRAGLQFNASYWEGVGLYAVTAWRRVGVDIERVRQCPTWRPSLSAGFPCTSKGSSVGSRRACKQEASQGHNSLRGFAFSTGPAGIDR